MAHQVALRASGNAGDPYRPPSFPKGWSASLLRRLRRIFELDYCPLTMPWFASARGRGTMDEIHRLALRRLWALYPNPKARARLVLAALCWPATSLVQAIPRIRRNWRTAKRQHGIGLLRQLADIIYFANVHNINARQYYGYNLYLPERRGLAGQYFLFHDTCLLSPVINDIDDNDRLAKKYEFYKETVARGLPGVPLVASLRDGRVEEWFMGRIGELPRRALFLKPSELWCGIGAEAWMYDPEEDAWRFHGRMLGEAELLEHFLGVAATDRYVLQAHIANRADIQALGGGGTSTIRLVTGCIEGQFEAMYAVLRIPVGANHVDNYSDGGLSAGVDIETGVLRAATYMNRADIVSVHPDTGSAIEGFRIEDWDEVVRVGVEAHRSYPEISFIGWDVVIAPDGPRILEANLNPGTDLAQDSPGRPLGATRFVCILEANLDRLRSL